MKANEALAKAIAAEGKAVFGLMGDGNIPIWGALHQTGAVEIYAARHEAAAIAMADGFHRATGDVGIATVTWGPGLTQIGTSLMVAFRNASSLVVVVPEHARGHKNKLQVMDQRRYLEACSTRCISISSADNLLEEVAEAFYAARVKPGPVALLAPMDVLDSEYGWDWNYRSSVDHVPDLAEGPTEDTLILLMDALLRAERPIIVAGKGAKLSDAATEIAKLADHIGALLATSLQAKGLFEGHPYNIGIAGAFASRASEQLFADADFVLAIGAELGYYTTEGGLLFPTASVARIDTLPAPSEIGLLPGLYVRGDARKTTIALNRIIETRNLHRTGFRTNQTRATMSARHAAFDVRTDGLDPRLLMQTLSKCLPRGCQITCGAGHFFAFVSMYLAVPEEGDIQYSSQFGAVGQTLPIAIGMSVGRPDQSRLLIEGDGSLLFHLQELETVVRLDLSIVVLVINDGGYGAEVHKLSAQGYAPELARWESPDFVALAKAFGGDGLLLKRELDLPAALQRGLAAGGLFLIDARVSPTTLSDPYEKLNLGRENRAPLLRR